MPGRRSRYLAFTGTLLLGCWAIAGSALRAEVSEVRFARGFPISYMPLMVIEHEKLLEKHARQAGLAEVKAVFNVFSGPNATTDALLSGNVDIVSGGAPTLIALWAKTKGRENIRGISAVSSMPVFLNSRNPEVRSIKDFTSKDRIALPTVKLSYQAVVLQMAAEGAFGPEGWDRLDGLTVTLGNADAIVVMKSGAGEVNADFSSPPFQYLELETPGIHRVLSSTEVFGGPANFNLLWGTQKFHDENPKTYRALLDAMQEAMQIIAQNKPRAAQIFVDISRAKDMPVDLTLKVLNDPETKFTLTPNKVMTFADFLYRHGSVKVKPERLSDLFFPEAEAFGGD